MWEKFQHPLKGISSYQQHLTQSLDQRCTCYKPLRTTISHLLTNRVSHHPSLPSTQSAASTWRASSVSWVNVSLDGVIIMNPSCRGRTRLLMSSVTVRVLPGPRVTVQTLLSIHRRRWAQRWSIAQDGSSSIGSPRVKTPLSLQTKYSELSKNCFLISNPSTRPSLTACTNSWERVILLSPQ